ncbi:MAG TPA: CoB--CoM heterodisulfide reductase iron-sulfur subunit A family protein [Bacteroidales bacterium]|nr:CoB--CoM heterodisulfide reductase iron-sulfur subunit A family protein [Bacteroidales bacterium]HPJ58912.1 CoB--CoM heterodisulfide reductase iron-sulfur subunit A family protein [Bacteroidales bacterium]HPR12166.1 CoB--CoM heterodisulfide reductase iron-sulfur subunit A family protein [Bacteroidales bacterium]HRW84849.1 CoB--CoM heterodisulfide reductase iron-sulfur subunit A family protein [Bacteroidales bacterium]
MRKKLGVYICHCGGNISDYVDVEKVKEAVENEEGVFLARTTMFACSDATQKEMVEDIKKNELDGIVVASCSPKLHLITFRAVTERADLNKYNYVHSNIREQGSWAHSDDKAGATEKAIHLVKAAVAKVRLSKPLEPIKIPSKKAVVVIGAGIAGMRSAIELSDMQCPVTLIEKEHFVGGRVAQWDVLFTTDQTGKELVSRLYSEIEKRENISLLTGAEVITNTGSIGDFKLKVKITPRYIKEKCDRDKLKKAIELCPVEVPDEFNFNITTRKAIYHNFPSEYPQYPVIDMTTCTRCGECEKVCESVDFSMKEEIVEIEAGSVLVATGFDPYTPSEGEFGYVRSENVVTLPQFKRIIDMNSEKLIYRGMEIRNIAYIYCVGSRQSEGENKYCSRYCCTSAIHASIKAKKKFPGITNFHFTRGIRTYGKQELLYAESLKLGDIYLQSYEEDPPTVSVEDNKVTVRINDILTGKREISVEPDLTVLITGMVPRADKSVSTIFKLPRGRDNFFNEIHMKLRPVETVIDGITIAGAGQGPKNITESISSGLSAAAKSFSFVSKGELELEPIIAEVDNDACTWCGECEKACPFDAIKMEKHGDKDVAVIKQSVCKGCGMCLPVCPVNAINLIAYSDNEIESMIDALAGNHN